MKFRVLVVAALSFFAGNGACQAAILYVSSTGSDAAACTLNAPCGSFFWAHERAANGDTIVCLSPPAPATLQITKSVSIDCTGSHGEFGDSAYTYPETGGSFTVPLIVTGTGNTVRLRGLHFQGGRAPGNSNTKLDRGIQINGYVAAVFVEDCVISGFGKQGILDRRFGGQTRLYVRNTVISETGGPGIVAASQGPAVVVLDNVSLLNNTYGIAAATGNNVVITRSTISGNTTAGIHTDSGARINMTNSVLSNNSTNVNANGSVILRENDIFFSNTAIAGSGAVSLGANRFSGNAAIGSPPSLASGAPADVFY